MPAKPPILTDITIRKAVTIALFSDDFVSKILVLKGGNAIEIVYGVPAGRASFDVDASIKGTLNESEEETLNNRIKNALEKTFAERGYKVFDYSFEQGTVETGGNAFGEFWGGYIIHFKIINNKEDLKTGGEPKKRRDRSEPISITGGRTFQIQISKGEYCGESASVELDGYEVQVYTPELLVAEKLRAICQQTEEYKRKLSSKSRPRGRDFFDIYILIEYFGIDTANQKFIENLKKTFAAKIVDLSLLRDFPGTKEFHRADFHKVEATVRGDYELKGFDFYFDFVLKEVSKILDIIGIV